MDDLWDLKYFWKAGLHRQYVGRDRFELLLLEPGEIYFEDFSVYYYQGLCTEQDALKRRQKGRLKVCSKSVVFVPLDHAYPIVKLLYKDATHVGKWSGMLLSRLDDKGDIIAIDSKLCICMREGDVIAPYQYIKEPSQHLFSLNFVSFTGVLPQIDQLRRATTLNPHEQATMISTIVQSRQTRLSFDTSWIEDLYEKIVIEARAEKISPLVCNPGLILLTSRRLYFQPFNNVESAPVIKILLSNVKSVVRRRYLLRHVGIEIIQGKGQDDAYFIFETQQERDAIFTLLLGQEDTFLEEMDQDNMVLRWQNGAISNFEYLMYLNSKADRSFNDLTQYPVFPWIIKDYTSAKLDLDNPDTFRDLSKPIGAMDPERLSQLKERCRSMPEPKFLYGSHYSTPGFVLFYLVRVAPEYMLCLQNGRFDKADRLFNSVADTWRNCCTGHSDFKELIPEFYASAGDFLLNKDNLRLGIKQDGSRVHNVELPPWATCPQDFVKKCREALECDYVSSHLNLWIDLIFGYKQRGEEAWSADNVFYYLTYEGAIDLESIDNPNEKRSYEAQIYDFGQTPKQLFTKPHPQRSSKLKSISSNSSSHQLLSESGSSDVSTAYLEKSLANSRLEDLLIPLIEAEASHGTVAAVDSSRLQWTAQMKKMCSAKLHKDAILGVGVSGDGLQIVTVSQDTQLKMFSVSKDAQVRGMNLSSMALSCCQLLPGDNIVLIGCWNNNIYVYSVTYGRVIHEEAVHDDAVTAVCWKDNILLTCSWDCTVKVWDCSLESLAKKPVIALMAELDHDSEVTAIDTFFMPDKLKPCVVSGTRDGHVLVWSLEFVKVTAQLTVHSRDVTQVLFSPDGSRILTCSLDHHMRVIDVSTSSEIYAKNVGGPIRCAIWDGQVVVTGLESGDLVAWDLVKVTCLQRISAHSGAVCCISASLDCKVVASGGEDGFLAVWNRD